jgi:hypothetical protein
MFGTASMIHRMVGAVNVATSCCDTPAISIAFVGARDRHSQVKAATVAKKFRLGLEKARTTLKATTQRGVQQSMHPLLRRYLVDHLNLNRKQ